MQPDCSDQHDFPLAPLKSTGFGGRRGHKAPRLEVCVRRFNMRTPRPLPHTPELARFDVLEAEAPLLPNLVRLHSQYYRAGLRSADHLSPWRARTRDDPAASTGPGRSGQWWPRHPGRPSRYPFRTIVDRWVGPGLKSHRDRTGQSMRPGHVLGAQARTGAHGARATGLCSHAPISALAGGRQLSTTQLLPKAVWPSPPASRAACTQQGLTPPGDARCEDSVSGSLRCLRSPGRARLQSAVPRASDCQPRRCRGFAAAIPLSSIVNHGHRPAVTAHITPPPALAAGITELLVAGCAGRPNLLS